MHKVSTVFILQSIHQVLKAEKALQRAGLPFDLIPVPKEVNPECGMAIETSAKDAARVRDLLVQSNLRLVAVYRRSGKEFTLVPEPGPSSPR
jgi:hypothetical protein